MNLLFGPLISKEQRARRRAQRRALREIRRLMRTTDMRLGQIIVNAGRTDGCAGHGGSVFYCTDERWAERLRALRRREKILAPVIKAVAEKHRTQPPCGG